MTVAILVVSALVLVPGIGAALAFAPPGAILIETRIALAFGLGFAAVAGTATLLALAHAFEQWVFIVAVVLVTAGLWAVAFRRASPREHLAALRSQASQAPVALGVCLALLLTVALTRPLWPASSSLSIRSSWRYWADALETAAAGRIPAQTEQWGTEFPATVSKAALNSFGGGISFLVGPDPFPAMQAVLVVTAVGLVAAFLALGCELGLGMFAPLVPAIVILTPAALPISEEIANNLRNYTAESMGRMVAFSVLLAGIYAVRTRSRTSAVVTGLGLAVAALTHLIPTLIAGAILALYVLASVLTNRSLLKSALVSGAIMTAVFGAAWVTVIVASGGDLGFQRAAGASESDLPSDIDTTASFGQGKLIEKQPQESGFLLTPGELLRRYGEESFDRPVAVRYTVLVLAVLALLSILMVRKRRSLFPLAVIAWGLCAVVLAVAVLFSYRFDTLVPGDWGARRLYHYAALLPALLVPGLLQAFAEPLIRRSRAAVVGASVLVGLLAIVAAIDRIPDRSLPKARAGLEAIDRVAANVPCDARMLSNARTAGAWEALTGRRAVTEGHAVFLRPEVMDEILPVLIGANEFFNDPAANRDFLDEQRVEYIVVVEPGAWVGTTGYREPREGDADAIAALPGVEPVDRDEHVSIFRVDSNASATRTAIPRRCPL